MTDEWYYVVGGETVGPVGAEEIVARITKAANATHLVWAPGMPAWVDARTLPRFSQKPARAPANNPKPREGLSQRARHEAIAFLGVAGYLLVWFTAVLFYKSAVLRSVGIAFAPFGIAVVKALILAKFILVLEAVKFGERRDGGEMLIVQVVKKALLFTIALFAMSIAEELVVGHFHGRGVKEVLGETGGGTLPQAIATAVLMFLVLLPYLAFRRIALETGELPELLFSRRSVARRRQE
jgi:hypothetical protein